MALEKLFLISDRDCNRRKPWQESIVDNMLANLLVIVLVCLYTMNMVQSEDPLDTISTTVEASEDVSTTLDTSLTKKVPKKKRESEMANVELLKCLEKCTAKGKTIPKFIARESYVNRCGVLCFASF
ncbi:unnamed protein product [Cylicocyclus nassatus]|uniref:Uncharacterized protein n=1 Tax=Cylicocyclus nassatus TaxID=53992 RepID=A0AA36GWN6_CYLNA|nr:unnamed protein product [Cylicocyclus nassatus]